ncbi:MAG TPA: hypothetical protein VFC44_19565, partial [Candidatus Saccharimonadales bacterium]|nr:hypothetical protein [Candidatus Saccharimonadales bacterium]
GLHFESMTVSNNFHNTWNFSFQSTNLFQDVTRDPDDQFSMTIFQSINDKIPRPRTPNPKK